MFGTTGTTCVKRKAEEKGRYYRVNNLIEHAFDSETIHGCSGMNSRKRRGNKDDGENRQKAEKARRTDKPNKRGKKIKNKYTAACMQEKQQACNERAAY